MQNRKGFTLAEVLITLSIIGVVAALTIPAITASTNQSRAKTSIKKAVSVLNQALTISIAQDGMSANSTNSTAGLRTIFQNYLSILSNDANSVTTADGMIYTFYVSGTAGCTEIANNVPNTSTCLVELDMNGANGSNVVSNTSNWSDLYYFIVKDSEVVPANTPTANSFTIPAGLRGAAGTLRDDVSQNALLN